MIKGLSVGELGKQVLDVREKLAAHKFDRYTKQSKNLREAWGLRQKLAVMLTVLKEKELTHE